MTTLISRLKNLERYNDGLEPFWGDCLHEGFAYQALEQAPDHLYDEWLSMLQYWEKGHTLSEEFVVFMESINGQYVSYQEEE